MSFLRVRVVTADTFPLGARSGAADRLSARCSWPARGRSGRRDDRDAALAVLRRAVELGVNHIDTAQYYGPDVVNDLIREALHPYPEDLALVTKVGAVRDADRALAARRSRRSSCAQGVLDNLRSLGVDRLDAVNLRLMDADPEADFDEQLDAMIAVRDEGLIAGIGLSNVSREQLVHAVQRTEIVCVQNPLNLLERESMPVLRECEELGIAFVPFFPLGSAFGGVNRLLTHPDVIATAERLAATPSPDGAGLAARAGAERAAHPGHVGR